MHSYPFPLFPEMRTVTELLQHPMHCSLPATQCSFRSLPGTALEAADVDGNGTVALTDALLALRIAING